MTTLTLRGIDDALAGALKEKARQEDISVNTLLLRLIRVSLGLEKKPRQIVYTDLDHLAGTWSEQDCAEFEQATAVFEKVDEDMWK